MRESDLQVLVADYIRLKYPDILFHSDYGSGIKLTPGQAIIQKRQNGGQRGWPDIFIAEARYRINYGRPESLTPMDRRYRALQYLKYGLFIELKKDGTRLKKKNGEWATPHIAEQAEVLQALRDRGYEAEFAVGFEEARLLIDGYLGS